MPRNADLNPVASGLLALAVAGDFSSLEESAAPLFDCQSCGACCSYSAEWPRFSTEDDAQLDRIPAKYVSADEAGMRCDGTRCSALAGEVGKSTACGIYEIRPDVCRACMPGGDDCLMARQGTRIADAVTSGVRAGLCGVPLLATLPAGRAREEPS